MVKDDTLSKEYGGMTEDNAVTLPSRAHRYEYSTDTVYTHSTEDRVAKFNGISGSSLERWFYKTLSYRENIRLKFSGNNLLDNMQLVNKQGKINIGVVFKHNSQGSILSTYYENETHF